MTKLLIANWKANPKTIGSAIKLAKSTDYKNVVIVPPFPFIERVKETLNNAKLGAQDVFWASGPYTGEVSVDQLKKLGVKYVIVGHSERRRELNETDDMINRKLRSVLDQGLTPVLCVGEGPEFRGDQEGGMKFVKDQLKLDLIGVLDPKKLIVAYEPIWAIGTGLSDSSEHVSKMAKLIKECVGEIPVLYGGSVDVHNIEDFISSPDISGALVGGASLKAVDFKKMIDLVSGNKS